MLKYEIEQAGAYKNLTEKLGLTPAGLIEYIQVGLVRNYPSGNLVVAMKT